jgi:hypothetical protein
MLSNDLEAFSIFFLLLIIKFLQLYFFEIENSYINLNQTIKYFCEIICVQKC